MIFDLIQKDNFYFASCMKITRNKDDAYDLMMDTATLIEEQLMPLNNPHTLFYTIAMRTWMKENKHTTLDFEVVDEEYTPDVIDFCLEILKETPKDRRQFITFSIFKLYLQLGTHQEVADYTNISRDTITAQLIKFKKYALKRYRNSL